jgi:hypothetical protein
MPIKSVSTQIAGLSLNGTNFLKVATNPVLIYDIEGDVNSTTGTAYFLQIHGVSPSSTVTVPLWSRLVVPASAPSQINGFSFIYRPIGLDTATLNFPESINNATAGSNIYPVFFAISSTDDVYTAVNATTRLTVDIEDTYQEYPNQTIAGDISTGVEALTIWASPSAAHKLMQIVVSNSTAQLSSGVLTIGATYKIVLFAAGDDFTNVGATRNDTGVVFIATGTTPTVWSNNSEVNQAFFLMLFSSAPVAGQLPQQQWLIADTNTFHTLRFDSGLIVQSQGAPVSGANPTDYAYHTGCYLAGSTTTRYLTATTGTKWTMEALYI